MHEDVSRIIFSEQELADRVAEMGAAITRDYASVADEGIVLVSVLRGAAIFMADLCRRIDLPLEMDYMAVSSYGSGAKSSGAVSILKDVTADLTGKHVIVAEDILDSGLTLTYLLGYLASRGPASVEVATLLRKQRQGQARRKQTIPLFHCDSSLYFWSVSILMVSQRFPGTGEYPAPGPLCRTQRGGPGLVLPVLS